MIIMIVPLKNIIPTYKYGHDGVISLSLSLSGISLISHLSQDLTVAVDITTDLTNDRKMVGFMFHAYLLYTHVILQL